MHEIKQNIRESIAIELRIADVFCKLYIEQKNKEYEIYDFQEIKRQLYDGFDCAEVDSHLSAMPTPEEAYEIFGDALTDAHYWLYRFVRLNGFLKA